MLIRRCGHVVAKSVGEISRVNSRINPASYTVCDSKSYRARVVNATNEEGIVARIWAGRLPTMPGRLDSVVRVEVEDVGGRIVRAVFANEGGGNMI